MLNASEANALAQTAIRTAQPEWRRLARFVRYARGRQRLPWLPEGVENEYRDIATKSASNWIDLVIRSATEGLIVDGYGDGPSSDLWSDAWQANGMDARQHALHRATGVCGYGYLPVLPAQGGGVWMRPVAATSMFAEYDDPGDEWPRYAVRELVSAKSGGAG